MVRGQEFHPIVKNIFGDVKGYLQSEQIQVCCPRCQAREGLSHPDGKFNLEINTAKRVFRCWKCDEPKFSGLLGRLIKMYGTRMDYEIYKSYAGIFYDTMPFSEDDEYLPVQLPSEMILFSELDEKNPEHIKAYNYMVLERKISRDIMLKYQLGFCVTGKYAKRIIIPSYDINGEVNYFVGRSYDFNNKTAKYLNPQIDKDKIIFNEGFINWDSTVYLVEGVFEMLTFPVNSIPMLGKTISPILFNKLNELKSNVVVLLDPDAYKNSIELYYALHNIYVGCESKVRMVKLPNNEDLDELRRNHGIDTVIKQLYTANSLTVDDYFINKLYSPYNGRKKRYNTST